MKDALSRSLSPVSIHHQQLIIKASCSSSSPINNSAESQSSAVLLDLHHLHGLRQESVFPGDEERRCTLPDRCVSPLRRVI